MSEHDTTGNGGAGEYGRAVIDLATLRDQVIIDYNRADGTLSVGGKICNLDVALDMCLRAARFFETQLRLVGVMDMKQRALEQQRVQDLLARTRGARV